MCALPRAYLRTGNFPRATIWRLCRNKGLHPLRRVAAIPAHPQKQYTRRWRLYHFCGFYYPIREVIPIAIYHWNIGIVSRGKGKSAVAAAAYRSGEKLTNEWDGMTHDYTRKGGVVHNEIMLPPHAPPSFSDRSTLWNSVELYEKAGNAQLAREIDAALPIELSREEQIRLVREYCYNTSDTRGQSRSYGLNYQKTGKELMSRDELSVMDRNKCILQLRGVRQFLSDKFDITKHKRYRELSDYDEKNAFDVEAYMKHQLKIRRQEEFDLYEVDGNEAEEHETEKTVN